MLTTPSNSNGTLNPEAHEFKYKTLSENLSKSNDEPNKKTSENDKKTKGKLNLKKMNMIFLFTFVVLYTGLCVI